MNILSLSLRVLLKKWERLAWQSGFSESWLHGSIYIHYFTKAKSWVKAETSEPTNSYTSKQLIRMVTKVQLFCTKMAKSETTIVVTGVLDTSLKTHSQFSSHYQLASKYSQSQPHCSSSIIRLGELFTKSVIHQLVLELMSQVS